MIIRDFKTASAEEAIINLPAEYHSAFKKKELSGAVAYFAGKPVGTVAWKKADDAAGELLSLYVAPEARRLGIGTGLLGYSVIEMQKAGLKEIKFKYSDYGDRTSLTPFFNDSGFETDVDEMPLGRMKLSDIRTAAKKKGIDKARDEGDCIFDLDGKVKAAARNALSQVCGVDLDIYDRQWPGTYVLMDGNNVKTAAFLREEDDNLISLDYLLNSGSPENLASLIEKILNRISEHYSDDTEVEMLLATGSGAKLYEAMFGKTHATYRMASCRQPFDLY
ncbi:MAG: GNAT family N-acetyltransferase [Lachnospiraceae bacterium]|nr:GNAT family N-acetyltransferase [Lachnospiraceae bacterium]